MFNLTKQEKQAILFVVTVALIGTGINFLVKTFVPVKAFICLKKDYGKVNLNTADEDLLDSLPGVGRKLAKGIIEYRAQYGRILKLEDLRLIKGFTRNRIQKISALAVLE